MSLYEQPDINNGAIVCNAIKQIENEKSRNPEFHRNFLKFFVRAFPKQAVKLSRMKVSRIVRFIV